MKKIGILYGMEQTFPPAIVDYINNLNLPGITSEIIKAGAINMDNASGYNVIFDRVSKEVPYFMPYLKNAALNGTRVVNNPFWSCAHDIFFHSTLATKIGIKVPRTMVLPSKEHPTGANADSMRNLIYPLNWEEVFDYIGFPAYLKPNVGNGFYNAYRVYNRQEFFSAYDLTGNKVMILQEVIDYKEYYRCYIVGKKEMKIMKYDPQKPQHLRYSTEEPVIDKKMYQYLEKTSFKMCKALGFDFNAIEFAISDDEAYAIDFLNPLPNAERAFLHEDNFNWLVKTTGEYLVELARQGKYRSTAYNWSQFLRGPKSPAKKRRMSKLKK